METNVVYARRFLTRVGCLDRDYIFSDGVPLTVVPAALVGGAPGIVTFDIVGVVLQTVVLGAVVRVAVDRVLRTNQSAW